MKHRQPASSHLLHHAREAALTFSSGDGHGMGTTGFPSCCALVWLTSQSEILDWTPIKDAQSFVELGTRVRAAALAALGRREKSQTTQTTQTTQTRTQLGAGGALPPQPHPSNTPVQRPNSKQLPQSFSKPRRLSSPYFHLNAKSPALPFTL